MPTLFGTSIVKGEDSFQLGFEAGQKAMAKARTSKVDFSIVFCSAKYDYRQVIKGVRKATNNAPLIGCSSSGEFTDEGLEKQSVACAVLSSDNYKFFSCLGSGLRKNETKTIKDISAKLPKTVPGYPYLSAIMLIDGLAGKGEKSVLAALEELGPNVKFCGGSAGDDFHFKVTNVFTDDQVATDAVSLTLIASRLPVAIGVKHGHYPISAPLTVTKAIGNIVYEIDHEPAFIVWKKHARRNAKNLVLDLDKELTPEEVKSFLMEYEAGILMGSEYKIRWPGSAVGPNGELTFVCEVPEGTVLRVMESTQDDQVDSAREAAKLAIQASKNMKLAGAVIFDCACRASILGNNFSRAVNEIKDTLGIPLIGFETYGEIAMEMGQLSGFHNTTTVVLLLPA